ncbi:MAG TPA: hypothetical protein VFX59_15350 [Polyangiales bacterium]|nr:hypothetical protein [Polyangiales bacterium]
MTRRSINLTHSVLTLALVLAHGCAAEVSGLGEESNEATVSPARAPAALQEHLIAEVPFENGGAIQFFEPEPGVLLTRETGPSVRETVADEETLTAAQLYTALTGKAAPERLVELSKLIAEREPTVAVTDEESEDPKVDKFTPANGNGQSYERNTWTYFEFWDRYCADAAWKKELSGEATRQKTSKASYYKFGIYSLYSDVHYDWLYRGNWISDDLTAGWYIALTIDNGTFGNDSETKAAPVRPNDGVFTHCVTGRR